LKLNEKELSERINKIESLILDVGDGVEGNDGGDRLDRLNKAGSLFFFLFFSIIHRSGLRGRTHKKQRVSTWLVDYRLRSIKFRKLLSRQKKTQTPTWYLYLNKRCKNYAAQQVNLI